MIKYGVKYADKNDGRTYYVTDDYSVSTNPSDAASFTSRDELKEAAHKALVENEYMIDESHFRTYWSMGRIRGFAFDDDGRINLNQSRKPIKSAARPSYTIRGEELHEGDEVYVKSEDKYGTVNLLNGNMVDVICDDGIKLDDIWADDCEIIKSKQDKEWECDDFMMNSLKRKPIKSGWTFRNAVNTFKSEYGRFNDYWEMQQAWEAFKDGLARDGEITQKQSDNWGNPCTPETFKKWNGKEESEDDIYSSKKPIKSADDMKDGDYWISRVDNGWWNDEIERCIGVSEDGEEADAEDIEKFIKDNFPNLTREEYKEMFKIVEGIACSIAWNKITSSRKSIKSGWKYNELDNVIDCLYNIIHVSDDGAYPVEIRNEADSLKRTLLETDWNDELIYRLNDFASELAKVPGGESDAEFIKNEIKEYTNIKSSRKPIKSAVDGGWEVDSSDASKALDMWVDYVGEDNALEDLAQATGDNNLEEDIEWISRQFGAAEEIEEFDNIWDKHNRLRELMGVHEYFENLWRAMGSDELAACMAFIFRMNDFQQWDDENGIYQSKQMKNLANIHKLYS